MSIVIYVLLTLIGLLALFAIALLVAELRVVNRLAEVNKQLLIVVAGKDEKPGALRALIASNKPPQGKLRGIASKQKKENKSENTNYTMEVGVH